MLHHAYLTVYPYSLLSGAAGELPEFDRRLVIFFRAASTPVALFIAISGFSLMLPVAKWGKFDGALSFYMRRIWRITPPYYVGLIASAVLGATILSKHTGSHWDWFVPFDFVDLIKHVLFVQNFSVSALKINGAYWSIAAERQKMIHSESLTQKA
jgi:peptidoglycan/LPS O-acetylase OafA/YrhL